MIDEKKINKAMSSYATETFNHIEERFAAMCGFKEGAEWAQKEFIKSLWHDVSKEPEDATHILVISDEGNFPIFHNAGVDWQLYAKRNAIERWCYLSDLLPKEGGEK